jgi:WXG100 family type VII secretion target
MTMPRIVMPHEEVAAAAGKFAAEAVAAATAVQTLKGAVAGLVWEGLTKEAFYQRHEQAQVIMREYHELLDLINRDLAEIAERFKLADEARINGGGGN